MIKALMSSFKYYHFSKFYYDFNPDFNFAIQRWHFTYIYFLQSKFKIYISFFLDLPIIFVTDPPEIRNKSANEFEFTGCRISTTLFNAIQNNTKIIFTSSNGTVMRMKATLQKIDFQLYETNPIQIDSFDQYGSYRCEVKNPLYLRKAVLSKNSSLLSSVNCKFICL